MAIAFPLGPRKEKTFTLPPDILEAGSFTSHNNAKIEEKAIAANCIGVKGFLLSVSNASAFALLSLLGFKPISPKIS